MREPAALERRKKGDVVMRINGRKVLLFSAVALAAAFAIVAFRKPAPYVEQLVRIQTQQQLAHIDERILAEPVEVQGVLLDYAAEGGGNDELLLKAWIALAKYGEAARDILLAYGSEPEFKTVLKKYGEPIIPVIQYFREHEVKTVTAMDATGKALDAAQAATASAWNRMTGKDKPAPPVPAAPKRELGPVERGWYAVGFIEEEGHDFLAQFTELSDRTVRWNQTDRWVKAATSFFTSGIRRLETKYDLGQVAAGDVGWAALDVALIAAPLKLLRAGTLAARSGEGMSVAARTAVFAPRLVARARLFQGWGKFGALAATVYIVATHPSLVNSLLGEAAALIGFDPRVAQFIGWFFIILVLLYPLSWILKILGRVILGVMWLSRAGGGRPLQRTR